MSPVQRMTVVAMLSVLSTTFSHADDGSSNASAETNELLTNFGAYVGYDLTTALDNSPYHQLLQGETTLMLQQAALASLFGALPVNAFLDSLKSFVPSQSTYSNVNDAANYTFRSAAYQTPNSNTTVSVNSAIDQSASTSDHPSSTYLNDPVSQSILNTLNTPHYSFCMNNDQTAWLSECDYLYDKKIISNVSGTLPKPNEFFSYTYNEPYIPQLNANTLIAPLLLSTENISTPGSSSSHLTAKTQLQEAYNFIRYLGFDLSSEKNPSYKAYNELYSKAVSSADATHSVLDIANAQLQISEYLAKMRTYAARTSVPLSNFYFILSKRLPQTKKNGDSEKTTSAALNEYLMATQRIYDPSKGKGEQWVDQINTASPATVQKEIAILLSQISYQLYLNQQIAERQLLTTSLSTLMQAHNEHPSLTTDTESNNTTNDTSTSGTSTTESTE